MRAKNDYITEAIHRASGDFFYGEVCQKRGRIIFAYLDSHQLVWDEAWGCRVAKEVKKSYSDLVAFSKDWHITGRLPFGT